MHFFQETNILSLPLSHKKPREGHTHLHLDKGMTLSSTIQTTHSGIDWQVLTTVASKLTSHLESPGPFGMVRRVIELECPWEIFQIWYKSLEIRVSRWKFSIFGFVLEEIFCEVLSAINVHLCVKILDSGCLKIESMHLCWMVITP